MEQNNSQNTNINPQVNNSVNKPVSEDQNNTNSVPGLGLKGSILKPQTDKDKKEYEKAIEKVAKNKDGSPSKSLPIKTIIGGLVAVLLIAAVVSNLGNLKQTVKKAIPAAGIAKNDQPKILECNPILIGNNLSLKVKTSKNTDKTSLLLSGKMYTGNLINEEENNKNWEFTVQGLSPAQYTYKCYAKDTKSNKFSFENGTFVIK